jgi:hypothetical protein
MQIIKDYGALIFTIATMLVGFGALNSQLDNNTLAIEKAQVYKERIIDIEKSINTMQLKVEAQHEWQGEFLISFKDLIKELKDANAALGEEIKSANHELGKEMQAMNVSIMKNQFTIKSVSGSVAYGKIYDQAEQRLQERILRAEQSINAENIHNNLNKRKH